MSLPKTLCLALTPLLLAWALPTAALTADQVIKLREAGVSNETIQAMIDTEMKVGAQGGVGRYTKKLSDGKEVIVYQASSPRGVVDYPVDMDDNMAGVDRLGAALGVEARAAAPQVSQAAPASQGVTKVTPGGYTLHIASFQNPAYARDDLAKLQQKGISARLLDVDIPGKGHWQRLLSGSFATRQAAETEGQRLVDQGKIETFQVIEK